MTTPQSSAWNRALAALREFVPAAGFSYDDIAAAAELSGKPLDWTRIEGFDDLDDIEIWERIELADAAELGEAPHEIIIIADACYVHDIEPLKITLAELHVFIEQFVENYDEQLFGGDVIILFPNLMLAIHHEGVVAAIRSRT